MVNYCKVWIAPRARQVAICFVYSMDTIQIYPTKKHDSTQIWCHFCSFELILTANIPSHFCHETIYRCYSARLTKHMWSATWTTSWYPVQKRAPENSRWGTSKIAESRITSQVGQVRIHEGLCGVTDPKSAHLLKRWKLSRMLLFPRIYLSCARLVHYYGKFIPNLPSILQPLNILLQKNQIWPAQMSDCIWAGQGHITSSWRRILIWTGSSDLAHLSWQYWETSLLHSLSSSEQNYSQLEKEAMSLIFGLKKFRQVVTFRYWLTINHLSPY